MDKLITFNMCCGILYEDRELFRKESGMSKSGICKALGKSSSYLKYHDVPRLYQGDEITSVVLLKWVIDSIGKDKMQCIIKGLV